MHPYMIRCCSAGANQEELAKAAEKSGRIGNKAMPDKKRWIRSDVVNEADVRLGTNCICEATDGEAIRKHTRRFGMPGDDFLPIAATVVVRLDLV